MEVMTRIERALAKAIAHADGTGGPPTRAAAMHYAVFPRGARIRARLPDEERRGVFEGIDATGALLLKEGTGTRAISAGEVFFG